MDYNILNAVEDSFSAYAAMTIQGRAIVDARDALKPAARQCMYAQLLDKITYKKPFKKSNKSVASALDHFYVHGDASCYALLTRLAKNFAMRYPLEDFDGSYGTISSGNSEAASRYTEMRLGELGTALFDNIDKNCIDIWFDNYDNTEQFPSVVPSLGFYNICNGAMGIATSLSTSIPQYNVKEVNEALIKLLYNPNIDFDEIYCAPDFCTGATILNGDEVKESHKVGCGHAAIIRSIITYDENEHSLFVSEIPYGVYAETICMQIKNAIEQGLITGIKNVLDLSTKKANIKIILDKNVNISKIVKLLYKLTSLQSSYTINLVMLDNGTTPKVFGWREALQAHLDHERKCYKKIHEFELQKIAERLNVVNGILTAIANIEEVIQIIKSSSNKNEAKSNLIKRFNFNEPQVDAILKMTLGKLSNLEIKSYQDEKEKLLLEQEQHNKILNSDELQKQEIKEGLIKIAEKYGDARRTKILNLNYKNDAEDAEPIEEKQLLIYYTNLGNIYTQESTTLLRTRRGAKGNKIKLANNEVIEKALTDSNLGALLVFTNKGKMYHLPTDDLPINSKININQLFNFEANERVTTLTTIIRNSSIKYFTFITKYGMIKKTEAKEYDIRRGKSIKAINLRDNDEVINVIPMDSENVGILTNNGNYVIIKTDDITPIGRVAQGIRAIKLSADDFVIDGKAIAHGDKFIITLSQNGLIKKTDLSEFPICNRGIKGKKISEIKDNDSIVKFLTLDKDCDIIIVSEKKSIKISTVELRELSRTAVGVKSIDLADNDFARDIKRGSDD